jgi:activating signal cointegrator 1
MKALSLAQPWASLVAVGAKRYETRSWGTFYRGPLAIHASSRMPSEAKAFAESRAVTDALWGGRINPALFPRYAHWRDLPLGAVIAIAELVGCHRSMAGHLPVDHAPQEAVFGDFTPGRWVWSLRDVKPIIPTPARGALGLWSWIQPEGGPR